MVYSSYFSSHGGSIKNEIIKDDSLNYKEKIPHVLLYLPIDKRLFLKLFPNQGHPTFFFYLRGENQPLSAFAFMRGVLYKKT